MTLLNAPETDRRPWQGVLIEQSLASRDLLDLVRIIKTEESTLEGEEGRGPFAFHSVEVDPATIDRIGSLAERDLLGAWYFHLVRDGVMKVFFQDHSFEAHKGDQGSIDAIRSYGMSIGIHAEQLPLETLMDDPFA